MRFGILSDCHLGVTRFRKISNLQNTYCDINNRVFKEALNIFIENKVDAIILAGDLFDSPNPGVQSIVVANALSLTNIPTYILGGNHDFSQRDHAIGCHPFSLLYGNNLNFSTTESKIFDLDDCELTMLPYKCLNEENYKNIYKGKLRDKKKNSILVFHGSVDLNDSGKEESEYSLPKEVATNYDLIIAGHVHIPQIIETKSTSILVPGSLMPSAQANSHCQKPAVYIYDTENKKIKAIELKSSPKIHEIITDKINECLEEISNKKFSNDLYFIRYNGHVKDIDEYAYKRANQNVLNLSIQTSEILETTEIKKVDEFWKFIEKDYPQYYDEFKTFFKED